MVGSFVQERKDNVECFELTFTSGFVRPQSLTNKANMRVHVLDITFPSFVGAVFSPKPVFHVKERNA